MVNPAEQKERERRFREKTEPFGEFTVREKTAWWNRIEVDNVLDRISLGQGALIADVGCSDGRVLGRLRERGRTDVRYAGTDFACQPLSHLKKSFPSAWAVAADATGTVFKPGLFDAAVSLQVIQQLPGMDERLKALGQIHDMLRPGGRFIVTVLNQRSWADLVANGKEGPLLSCPELSVFLYNPADLREELSSAGFSVGKIIGINNMPVRYLKKFGYAAAVSDMLISRFLTGLSLEKGRYLLAVCQKK